MNNSWAYKQMGTHARLPFPGQAGHLPTFEDASISSPDLQGPQFKMNKISPQENISKSPSNAALNNQEDFEEYILRNFRVETISKWLAKKKALVYAEKLTKGEEQSNLDINKTEEHFQESTIEAEKLHSSFKLEQQITLGSYLRSLHAFCSQLSDITISTGFNFYVTGDSVDSLHLYNPALPQWKDDPLPKQRTTITPSYTVGLKNTVASFVAQTRQSIIVEDLSMDERFSRGVSASDNSAVTVMGIPLIMPNNDIVGVVELYRNWSNAAYTPETLTIAQNCLDWVMLAVHKNKVSHGMEQQCEMTQFLLDVSKTYLDDISDIDSIIKHIIRFAKQLVSAERCCLFVMDKETDELYSNLFDNGEEKSGETIFSKKAEIRFSVSKGIAGHAATSKQILNITDAYADKRFYKEVDKQTGYTTKSILCMPILGDGEVYGVVEMINKKGGGAFTNHDQSNFQMFAVYCALALRYSKVHNRLLKDHCKYEVLREQYLYHSKYPEDKYEYLIASRDQKRIEEIVPVNISRFNFSVMSFQDELLLFFIKMVQDVTKDNDAEIFIPFEILARFVLSIRSNYRALPYHNWYHAMTVTHAMYCILIRNSDIFDPIERLSLLVACVCHDIDHNAVSNQFLRKVKHPLSVLYPSSTMECHHLNIALDIIHRPGNDIYGGLSDESNEKAVSLTRKAIMATDLALYFGNRSYIEELLSNELFNFNDSEHRMGAISLMMSACDISSTTKDWDETKPNVYDLYNEFWDEGDRRKELGIPLIPMMDRDLEEDLPDNEVGFYSVVVIKCFETLSKILPKCSPWEEGAIVNLQRWQKEADIIKFVKEERARKGLEKLKRERELEEEGQGLSTKGGLWMVEESRTRF